MGAVTIMIGHRVHIDKGNTMKDNYLVPVCSNNNKYPNHPLFLHTHHQDRRTDVKRCVETEPGPSLTHRTTVGIHRPGVSDTTVPHLDNKYDGHFVGFPDKSDALSSSSSSWDHR